MGIVSIGEVVGTVSGGASEQETASAAQAQPPEQGAAPAPEHTEALERQLRARASRLARLAAD